jgi:hypothetical protein
VDCELQRGSRRLVEVTRKMEHVDALALFEAVDTGDPFSEKESDHLRGCEDCRRLLWGYSHQQVRKLQRHAKKVRPFKTAA